MKRYEIAKFALLMAAFFLLAAGCALIPKNKHEKHAARLLIRLPTSCNTPDGATLDADGNIILSIPNFNNGELLKGGLIETPAPPKMVKIDKNNELTTWYEFREVDMHPDTGKIGPMDCAFGPDGNLYVADMQMFWDNHQQSRLLRINVIDGMPVSMDVVVEGFIAANGMVWKGDTLFVTETLLAYPKKGEKNPQLLSGVYAFKIDELKNGCLILPPFEENNPERHLMEVFRSSGRVGFGADGVAVDGNGNLYTSIIEDGLIYKTSFDDKGEPIETRLFARSNDMVSADGIVWRKEDNRIYVADILNNAVHVVDMKGNVRTLHKNPDTDGADGSLDQPCEVLIRGNELIVMSMDMPWEDTTGLLVNTKIDEPYTISVILLGRGDM
ncbi:MAG: SMP-30/gluconolactonase/LRE family protein [Desulfobacteraceae bacterium]|nr:SMP-30/gluconolactonase/LRE family protein [Desulfobacteraceae bacterium]MDH3573465.1 SMP-30/gluconolactonase/LRE family protein [Desulfobacteraceae bacterium]MDH3720819.1 SMP-30/gluconolactonase/LRE family protein [Desulfobacteraceae bacterium]MDH3874635.1 SMP-30/gluconolactonase/LRE family protein [Desulfobacteraceae bacterium]